MGKTLMQRTIAALEDLAEDREEVHLSQHKHGIQELELGDPKCVGCRFVRQDRELLQELRGLADMPEAEKIKRGRELADVLLLRAIGSGREMGRYYSKKGTKTHLGLFDMIWGICVRKHE